MAILDESVEWNSIVAAYPEVCRAFRAIPQTVLLAKGTDALPLFHHLMAISRCWKTLI
jgi:hypothetical protein